MRKKKVVRLVIFYLLVSGVHRPGAVGDDRLELSITSAGVERSLEELAESGLFDLVRPCVQAKCRSGASQDQQCYPQ
jgi:hypothetical protein